MGVGLGAWVSVRAFNLSRHASRFTCRGSRSVCCPSTRCALQLQYTKQPWFDYFEGKLHLPSRGSG